MTNYILFSPIGGTDPIENCADGPMLHICRVYKPYKVYLYLSGEMVTCQEKDERYTRCLEKLSQQIGCTVEVELIKRPDVRDVHLYESFYGEFEEQITGIQQSHSDCTLLLNVSSGTPAMKATLLTLAAIMETYNALAVQVATPVKAQNPRREDKSHFDTELYWQCNEDNQENFINRCIVQRHVNIPLKIKIKIMEDHIKCYDYIAALAVAKEIAPQLTKKASALLEAAVYRLQLNQSEFDKAINKLEGDYQFIPVRDGGKRAIFESILWLQIKQRRGDYVDFLRGITPVVVNLFETILKEIDINIRTDRFCQEERRGNIYVYKLKRELMERSPQGRDILSILDGYFRRSFTDSIYTSVHLFAILESKYTDEKVLQAMRILKETEEKARNLAAHTIIAVNDKWIYDKVGYNSAEVLEALKLLARGRLTVSPDWNSYDKMNDVLIEEINKRVR